MKLHERKVNHYARPVAKRKRQARRKKLQRQQQLSRRGNR